MIAGVVHVRERGDSHEDSGTKSIHHRARRFGRAAHPSTAEGQTLSYSVHRPIHAAAGLAAAVGLLLAPGVVPAQQVVVPAQAPGAQEGRITGVVTGEGVVPVAGSQVVVVGTRFGAVTSAEGRYTIVGVPAGTHQVRAQRIG